MHTEEEVHPTAEELLQLSHLIGLIYEGATDATRWTASILPAITDYVQAPGCLLFSSLHRPQDGGYLFIHGIAHDQMDLYTNRYQADDIWTITALQRNLYREGNVVIGEEHVPRQMLRQSGFYRDFLSRDPNMAQLLACVVFGADSTASLPAVLSLVRGFHHPDFGEVERTRMQLLLPHISRALGVMQRLRSAELAAVTTLAALERLPSAVLLLDRAGRVAFANREAARMLEHGDGLRLRRPGLASGACELDAGDASARRAIRAAINTSLTREPFDTPHFSTPVVVRRNSGLGAYTLQFSSLGEHNEFGAGASGYAAIVFVADSSRKPEIDSDALRSAYGLTPAEARAAVAVLEHVSAKNAAQALGVSQHTVRSQLQQVYAKLGVDTRARFIKVMLGLARQAP